VRIVYGIQSTGKGHLSRFLGLLPLLREGGHELTVFASGYEDPPEYFLDAVQESGYSYRRFQGVSYVGDNKGGVSNWMTTCLFLKNLPNFLGEFRRAQEIITDFAPDVIVSDFDPISGSPFVGAGLPKIGLSHQNVLLSPGMYHPSGMVVEKFFTHAVLRLFTEGLDDKLGCHFYPASERCLPPIIRPGIRDAETANEGHIIVYHTLPGMLGEVMEYARKHPDRRVLIYGYPGAKDTGNVHYEQDSGRFAADLASADAYVGTAGFQSISEAFYLGKKIAVRPIAGQYEQIWNAAQLEHYGMGCWYSERPRSAGPEVLKATRTLEQALDTPLNAELHAELLPWFRDGTRTCYERITAGSGREGKR